VNWQWVIVAVVVGFVAVIYLLYRASTREKDQEHARALAAMHVEAWEKTLYVKPRTIMQARTEQPVPNLTGYMNGVGKVKVKAREPGLYESTETRTETRTEPVDDAVRQAALEGAEEAVALARDLITYVDGGPGTDRQWARQTSQWRAKAREWVDANPDPAPPREGANVQ
jgi:hypothetical protein